MLQYSASNVFTTAKLYPGPGALKIRCLNSLLTHQLLMPHKSPAQRSGKVPAPSPIDYPTERAQRAAQRIYKDCGLWPADFARGFGPDSWSVQLTTELSVLIQLTIAAKNVQLDDVRQRLKALTAKHIRADHQRLLRSDIAKDDDLTEEEESEQSAEEHNTPSQGRETHEISSVDDDDIVEVAPPTSTSLSKSDSHFRVSSNNVNATPRPAIREPYTTATFAKPSSVSSNATSNTALHPKPNRNVVLGRSHGATRAISKSASSNSGNLAPLPPKATATSSGTIRAPVGMPRNNSVSSTATPDSPAALSPQSSVKPRGVISAPVGRLDKRPGTSPASPKTPVESSQRTVASAVGPSTQVNNNSAGSQPTSTNPVQASTKSPALLTRRGETPRTRPSNPNTATNSAVQPSPNDPSSLTRPNGPPKTNFANRNLTPSTIIQPTSTTPTPTVRPSSQARSILSTTPNLSAQPSPKRGGVLGPTQAANETRVANTKPASNTIVQPSLAIKAVATPTIAKSSTQHIVGPNASDSATNNVINQTNTMSPGVAPSNSISRTSSTSSNIAPNSTAQPKAATAPSLVRSNTQSTASPSHSDQGPSNIALPVSDTALTITRSNSQPEINPSSSSSTPTISRPRRNIQPPIRRIYDTPQSSVRLNEAGQSRKRPAESPTQVSPRTPNPPLPQPITATATTASNVPSSRAQVVPTVVTSSRTAPSQNNQSRNLIAGSHTNGMNPPAKRQKTSDLGAPRPLAGATLDWRSMLPSGDEFKESLKIATIILSPTIERFEELLYAIDAEIRALTSIQRTLQLRGDELAQNKASATDALKDVDTETSSEKKMLQDLEDLSKKHPGDGEFRAFIDKRKKSIVEHDEVRTIVKDQLDRSASGLAKVEQELNVVFKRLKQLDEERVAVAKEKEGADIAAKRLNLMSRFMEPGWQTRLEMLESMMGDERGPSQP
ncbi:hypothetical protein KAF25_010394 [Fusarium avenaceum]|uniref:Uncharacterized protein n=1 Tax=Fusarium avenaceum TaxID=40199 RepID=A0A9P7GUZ3_9HYPO|nr:hypothetical protein KAF25_010394 [Fusarium avenaceum]